MDNLWIDNKILLDMFFGIRRSGRTLTSAVDDPAVDRDRIRLLLADRTDARRGVIGDIDRGVVRVLEEFKEFVAAVDFH